MSTRRLHIRLDEANIAYLEAMMKHRPTEIPSMNAAINRVIHEHMAYRMGQPGAINMPKVASASRSPTLRKAWFLFYSAILVLLIVSIIYVYEIAVGA